MAVDTDSPDAAGARRRMVDQLTIAERGWADAFTAIPRHLFTPVVHRRRPEGGFDRVDATDPAWVELVYSDDSLVTQIDAGGQVTSSSTQPSVMGWMLDALDVRDGHRVLEIGTGTGYNAALLCHRLGAENITSIDVDQVLVDQARNRLATLGYHPTLVLTNGLTGWAPNAPYDRILGTCATHRVPTAWLAQIAADGIIVANVGVGLIPLRRGSDGFMSGRFLPQPAGFIPARTMVTQPASHDLYDLMLHQHGDYTHRTDLFQDVVNGPFDLISQTAIPGLRRMWSTDDDERWCAIADPATRSWARAVPDAKGVTVTGTGPRRLWTELETAHDWWTHAGRPTHERIGLTITRTGSHILWVNEPGHHSYPMPDQSSHPTW